MPLCRGRILPALAAILIVSLTLAAEAAREQTRLAFGSCVRQQLPQPIWDPIVDFAPDAFIFLGDNVYADTTDPARFHESYALLSAQPGFRRLKAACPIHVVWDDHDYGINDGGADFSAKEVSKEIFLDFFDVPADDPRRHRDGVYHVKEIGPPSRRIQLILLDTRFFKSPWTSGSGSLRYVPDPDPDLTILGPTQWEWLAARLRDPARLRILISSIQVLNDEHGFETWGQFPTERLRLIRTIAESGAKGLIIVSGDRHFGEISRLDEGVPYPLYDFTTSGMTHTFAEGARTPNRLRIGKAYAGRNFGTLIVDWVEDPLIRLQLRDAEGEVRTEHALRLGELQ